MGSDRGPRRTESRHEACNKSLLPPLIAVEMATSGHQINAADRTADWVALHGRAVRGYLLGLVGRPDLADDLVQEVFCRAWEARDRYREQGHARAYLLRIADRLACDRRRQIGRETTVSDEAWKALEPPGRDGEPAGAMARAEDARRLAAALEQLSPMQRRVLLLRYFGEMSFADIAETIDCPLGTVLSHCHRGLKALRKSLGENVS